MATIAELDAAQKAATGTTTATTETAKTQPLFGSTVGADKINAMYDAQKESQLGTLKSAYDQSKSEYQAAQEKIAPQYQKAANELSVQYERNRQNFNRQAAATGINTGTASQAALARQGEYQRDFGGLRTSESEAQAEAARQMALLESKYQSDVAEAIANNDYQRAAALYEEFKNSQNVDLKNAQILAEFGDFSGYEALYGKEEAENMFYIWAAQNPQLAYNSGRITADQYNNLIEGKPINAARSVAKSSSGGGSNGGGGYYGGSGGGSFTAYGPGGVKYTGLTQSQANAINSAGNKSASSSPSYTISRL